MIKNVVKVILISSLSFIALDANYRVIAKVERTKNNLLNDQIYLVQQLEGLVKSGKVKILHSSHPTWKWRLSVSNLDDMQSAKEVLNVVKLSYDDAYILGSKKNSLKKKNKVTDKTIEINFKDLKLEDFIKLVSNVTGKNILIPKKIDGEINFIGTKPIKESKLLPLLNQILLDNKYTLHDTQNGYFTIIKSNDAMRSGPPLQSKTDINGMQTAIIKFKNIRAMDIKKFTQPLGSKYGKISSLNNGKLIVTDFRENIESIKSIIKILDKDSDRTVKFVSLRNSEVDAISKKVKKMIRSFFKNQSITQHIEVIQNENSSSIALVGDKNDIKLILPYIKKLDKGNDKKEKDIELVYVKNSDAQSVTKLLNELIANKTFNSNIDQMSKTASQNQPIKQNGNRNGNRQTTPNGNNNIKIVKTIKEPKEQDNPGITYDKQLNAIMLFGTKQERDVLKSIIEKIDVERQQVYVKAKILEINNDKASELGLKYGIVGGLTNSSGLFALSNKMGLQDAGTAISLAKSLDLTLPNASSALALGAAVSLLSQESAANIISEPSILCINNEPSSLYVGKTVSVISQSSVGSTTTDINKNNYKREDIGLTLNILPRISSDNKVTLGVEISSEDILPGSTAGLPQTTKRVVKTSAIVKNGETIIIGGMAREKKSKTVIGIPILRNIPLLGKLFSHDQINLERTTLVLMLTPYIVKQSGDLTKLREELGELYLLEKEYGKMKI